MNGKLSNVFKSEIGVRQGDNLSPLLFSIYLSDLENFLSSKYGGLAYIFPNWQKMMMIFTNILKCTLFYMQTTQLFSQSHQQSFKCH